MRVVALLENSTERNDMQIEHGLSLYIEIREHKILFDMGQTEMFYENAKTLGIDLGAVDIAILSHGHYDHGGGLGKFLEINNSAQVYIQRDAFLPHFNGNEKYIGLDVALKSHPRIIFTGDECVIDDKIALYTCNNNVKKYPPSNSALKEKIGESFVTDDFRHEQYLLIKEFGKDIVISGCSHKGILNIMEWFSPDVLIGGFHYSKHPLDQELREIAIKLATFPTDFYTCHCTGREQYEFMLQSAPRLKYLSCGGMIDIL